MTIEQFSRQHDLPSSTVRRVLSQTEKSRLPDVGVSGSGSRMIVENPHRLRLAVCAYLGPRSLSFETLARLYDAAEFALRYGIGNYRGQEFHDELHRDMQLLLSITQTARAA